MNKLKALSLSLAIAGMFASSNTLADNSASDYELEGLKMVGAAALRAATADVTEAADTGFVTVLSTELKNAGTPKDLVVGVSFETMLMTETVIRSKDAVKDSSSATAEIVMRVLLDGNEIIPNEVTFDRRYQELWGKLSGILVCEDAPDEEGVYDGIISYAECNFDDMDPEEIGLILDTKSAHSFNFLAYDIGSGSHTIEVEAKLMVDGEAQLGTSNSSAALGKGTLSVWEVHGSTSKEE